MKKKDIQLIPMVFFCLLVAILIFSNTLINTYADNNSRDRVIVVSLGDSYSSGEGIEPFYGQTEALAEKVTNKDWLAHRSWNGWPSLLEIPGIGGTMSDYKYDQDIAEGNPYPLMYDCEWYFVASSGAETKHFNSTKQIKTVRQKDVYDGKKHNEYLSKQLDIFKSIDDTVDYVTLTVGGNDVGFVDVITKCATGSTYLGSKSLEKKTAKLWEEFDTTKANIKQVYVDIKNEAGSQADIIVAGYPKLLDKDGKGFVISKSEATIINSNISKFNDEIESIVNECRNSGMKIHFVNVEMEFDKDNGHQAYSDNEWINKIMLGANAEDLDYKTIASEYSVHPNELGSQAYARCVNAKIREIENEKTRGGILSGKICEASDRISPITGAKISVYRGGTLYMTASSDGSGNYRIVLPVGEYRVEVNAPGYIEFTAYAKVMEGDNTYMETFLMIEGSENETGIAFGTINNALTGKGVEGVMLEVRSGWNNIENGEIVTTVTTDSSGNYNVTLPLGNYILNASKDGYISTMVNIVVQSGTTSSQNGTITPIITSDNFRIVLTWGANPRDLDSHVVGTLSSGSSFHVYYGHKSQYDGEVEVCNLDVDDISSYGPETITLNITTDAPYYYYIYRYAGSGMVASSGAQVKLYQGETSVATFNVPIDQGSGDYWNVFAIVNGELVLRNTITSAADTSYAISAKSLLSDNLLDEDFLVEESDTAKPATSEDRNPDTMLDTE